MGILEWVRRYRGTFGMSEQAFFFLLAVIPAGIRAAAPCQNY